MKTEIAVFGGGCFWCTEAIYQQINGVVKVESGYAGHAEVIRVEFDPSLVSFKQLLDVFFHTHNPTTLNRQGADVGEQYRSMILTTSDEQSAAAKEMIKQLEAAHEFEQPIVTEVKPLTKFFRAEDYHQNYYQENKAKPYCQLVIDPKLKHFRKRYQKLLKAQ